MEEYDRLEREGKEHGRILVAERVPLEKWRRSKILSSVGQVVIEADFEDKQVTKKTRRIYSSQSFLALRTTVDLET